jgi:hypothetical protein
MIVTPIVHEFPGLMTQFRRAVPIEHHGEVLALVDGVLAVLRPFVRPIVVEVSQVILDLELGLPHPGLVAKGARIAVVYETPESHVVIDLSGATVVRAEGRPLATCIAPRDDAPGGHVIVAANGRLAASEARLPGFSGATLSLMTRVGQIAVPVRHDGTGAWVAGPLRETPTQPPIGVRWAYECGYLTLELVAGWSSWTEDQTGAALAAEATGALITSGWEPWDVG